ncbi:MAG: VOC family protein [Nakamurella sp.]
MTTNQMTQAGAVTQQQTAPGAWPTFSYRDAEAALRYLVDVVGFTESVVHRGDQARPISHAELLWPAGGGIMFGSVPPEEPWSGAAGKPGTSTAYLSTDDVAGVAARVTAAGWKVLRPLAETDYGSQEFAFADPEGNAWSIGTYRGAQG